MGCASSSGAEQASPKRMAPVLFLRLDRLLAQPEVPRLGVSPEQRRALGLGAKENITDPKVKETLVQDWRNLCLCVGDEHYPATDFLVELADIDMETSVVGFVSHCWLRGWPGAPGYQDRPHPDDAQHSKHKLTKEALTNLRAFQFSGCKECYVWIDFCCINQDGNPAAELKQLDLIIKSCDFLLTPVHDAKDGSWELVASVANQFVDYKAEAWQKYLTRGWCLVEMMYAANVPLKDNAASESRLAMMNGPALKYGLNRGHRAHFLLGTREVRLNTPPLSLPPLQNSFFDEYNPITHGEVTSPADRAKIAELVSELQPYIDARAARVGYVGTDSTRGRTVFPNGDVYEGEFLGAEASGDGEYLFANGDVYSGQFAGNCFSGRGRFVSSDGNVYEGEFREGRMHGAGRYAYNNGDVYEGEFSENNRNGVGKQVYANGDVYEGQYCAGVREGRGRYLSSNGAAVEGEFRAGAPSGPGWCRVVYSGGVVYEGDSVDGVPEGRGTITSPAGALYRGGVSAGAMSGTGYYRYEDGSVYEGEFRNDVRHGRGKLVYADGEEYEGEFVNDVPLPLLRNR